MGKLWEVYFSSKGRIGRPGFWFAAIGIVACAFVLTVVSQLIVTIVVPLDVSADASTRQAESAAGSSWAILAVLALMLVMAGNVGVKRAHDRGKTGQLYVAYLWAVFAVSVLRVVGFDLWEVTPAIGQFAAYAVQLYFLVVFGFLGGEQGTNKYGPDPRDVANKPERPVSSPPL